MRDITDITTTNPTHINIIADPTIDTGLTTAAIRMAATIDIERRLTSTHSEAASVGGLFRFIWIVKGQLKRITSPREHLIDHM
jgi:hypothetical protein